MSIIKKLINRALKRANTDDPSPDEKSNEIAREADNGSQEPPKILFDGFAKSIYPYKDICFIKLKKRDLRPAVSLLCERLELPVVSFGDFIRAGVAGNEPAVFSGYGYIDSKVCYGSLKSDYKFEDVTVSSGAFEFFEYENGRVRAATDFFGVCALFIYEDDNLILVTNRAHMAAIFSSISDKREINYPLIYTDIMFSTYFRECKSINETSIKGLIRVNTLNYVEIDDKISIIKIDINIHKYNLSYDDLLESSINETKNFYRSLKDSLPGYNYVFELTGGKDSRMNISPFINEDIKVKTYRRSAPIDKKISQSIVSIFSNIKYNYAQTGRVWRITYAESLKYILSYSFCFQGYFGLYTNAQYGTSTSIIFRGVYEIFRHYYNKNIPKDTASIEDLFAGFFESSSSYFLKNLEPEEQQLAKKCVLNDLSKRFGNYANIDRALTDYYWFGRWRAHFGRTRFEVMFGPLPAYPCLNQYSLAALRMLSEEDIENGKFIYDFISRSSEILANVEYERPFPAAELNRTFIANPIQERLDTVREEYESSLANIVVKDGDSTPERVEAHSQDERTESSARYYSDYDMSQLKIYDFLNIMLAKAIVRISNFDQKLRSFCYKMYGIWNAEYDWHIKQSIVSKILDLDNCLMPLDTIKSAYFSEENLIDLINPVETFSYSDNKIELTLFPYINPADFIFGLRVFADGKHYDYRMRPEPVFEIAQPSPTAIGIRTRRNRPDAPRPKYMQRKIVK